MIAQCAHDVLSGTASFLPFLATLLPSPMLLCVFTLFSLAIAQRERSPNTPLISIHYLCCDATKSTQLMAAGEGEGEDTGVSLNRCRVLSFETAFSLTHSDLSVVWTRKKRKGTGVWNECQLFRIELKKVPLTCRFVF